MEWRIDIISGKVALIGYAHRLPDTDAKSIWDDLCTGRDLVTEVDPSRWEKDSFLHPAKSHPGSSYTFAAGSIGDISGFDAGFFGISPREAACMDPQQRLLLELAWETMENAGIPPSSLRGSNCGVYIGISTTDYAYRLADDMAAIDSTDATGNTSCITANRISYLFDLHGPSMAIDTACSSSLVAFHEACQAIATGESDYALTGGVSLHLHPYVFLNFAQASMLSPRGRCHVFDASADGYVRSEGAGLFLLKDFDRAVADGDHILAVVSATSVNNDGHKSGLTVPNGKAQASLIEQSCRKAGLDPCDIDYFEAHGTGTPVGDPIETRAIGEALGQKRPKGMPLPVGSIKSNLGHLEAAAGVAGLVKALLSLQHRMVPATIGITALNPKIDFDGLNLEVVTENLPLKKFGPLHIGINAFGFGGANAHVILESGSGAPVKQVVSGPAGDLPLIISARDEAALRDAARDMAALIQAQPDLSFYDVAYNSFFRRELHPYRAVAFGSDLLSVAEEFLAFADGKDNNAVEHGSALPHPSGPAFIYDGNGAQWEGMGKGLLQNPLFLETVAEIDTHFRHYADFSLVDELNGRNGSGRYEFTEISQPALFAVQVGITCVLRSMGISPVAVTGHSVGEISAAWACGALTLADAVKVLYHRSRMQALTKGQGGMSAVNIGSAGAKEILSRLGLPSLALAGANSPGGVTVAGTAEELAQFEAVLKEQSILFRRLDLDYAFHSPAMDGIEAELTKSLADILPQETNLPFFSTVTGALLPGTELDAGYWWKNIRQPVLFEQAVSAILDTEITIFIEVSPHHILRKYVLETMTGQEVNGCVIPTGLRSHNERGLLEAAVAKALIAGVPVNRELLFPEQGRFVQLPTYPWQRERYWHPVTPESGRLLERRKIHPLLGYLLPQHELTWENQLDTALYPELADHAVGGATVFPCTGYLELVLAAALSLSPDSTIELEQLEIKIPMLLEKGTTRLVRLAVSAENGSVSIKGRNLLSESAWTAYGSARIVSSPWNGAKAAAPFITPARQPDFDSASHSVLTSQAGLQYGPAFQSIQHGWVDGLSASALLQTPEVLQHGLQDYHLHPTFLDNAFQLVFQIVQAEQSTDEGMTYVPVMIERVRFQPGMTAPRFAAATLTGRAPHSLVADFVLYDADRMPIATISQVRFKRIRLHNHGLSAISYPNYHRIPRPLPGTPVSIPSNMAALVAAAMVAAVKHAADDTALTVFTEELDPLLESLCCRFTLEALQHLSDDGCHVSGKKLMMFSADYPYLLNMVEILVADGIIVRTESGLALSVDDADTISARQLWQGLVNQYPDRFALISQVGYVGMRLSGLTGSQTVHDTEDVRSELLRQTLGAGGLFNVGHHVKQLVHELQQGMSGDQRLAVLEVAHGAPLWLDQCCAVLDFERSDYHFASGSTAALNLAEEQREQYQGINLHDLSLLQALPPAPCQLAIITCDFISQAAAEHALNAVAAAMAPEGCIILIGLPPVRWAGFLRTGQECWQPTAAWWSSSLITAGCESVQQHDLAPRPGSGTWLMTAQKQKSATPAVPQSESRRTLLLVHDDSGSSADMAGMIAEQVEARGNRCILLDDGSEVTIADSLTDVGELLGVLFLAGVKQDRDLCDDDAYLAGQVKRCAAASALARVLLQLQVTAPLWLITTGAAADLADWKVDNNGVDSIVDSAFWAFGRTMMNEYDGLDLRLFCLEDGVSEVALTALLRELEHSDGEQEVIVTAAGERYLPRLVLEPPPHVSAKTAADSDMATIRLGFQFPGQLRNLHWEEQPRFAPIEDEIELEVHATGLNFRDIMFTLGLLSDEAVENGFTGATLGLECAGTVISTGPAVTGIVAGDRVVAFCPASFGNRALTRVSAVVRIPTGLSFEAAATIPVTFFTAWYALCHLARLQPGEKVLIHGAAGGVGLAAIQIVRLCGGEVYATAGSDDKRDFLKLLGVEHIYDSRSLDFADQILQQTGGIGVDLVLNSLAGEAINRNLRVLKPFGRFLELGKRDFYENTRIGLRPFRNNISYFGVDADQLMKLHPELTQRLFSEIMDHFDQGVLHPLPYTSFEADQVVDAFRYMQHSRQIGKVVVTYRHGIRHFRPLEQSVPPSLMLNPESTWLVTGGLGGFGLRTAKWLVTKGCRSLALVSRTGPASLEAAEAISEFRLQGVEVYAAACDITDKSAVTLLLETVGKKQLPLKGIVHAAAVYDDSLLLNMQPEQLRNVMAPKILGALHLHNLTKSMPLDYFVLFSSATTLFGNPGQGNYVAANAWLEGLSRMRRASGLPATAVRWGAIDDVGFLARNQKIKKSLQERMGGEPLNSGDALTALELLLQTDRSGMGALEFDWFALRRFLPSASHARFSWLSSHYDNDSSDDHQTDGMHWLTELPDNELLSVVADMLKHEVGHILRLQPEKISSERSLYEIGMDSLMGVELVTALEARFGIKLPVMALSEGPTIAKLTTLVADHVRKFKESDSAAELRDQIVHITSQHAADIPEGFIDDIAAGMTATPTNRTSA